MDRQTRKPRLLYLLPGFYIGGAELGLLTLIDGGFFKDIDIEVAGVFRGTGALMPELEARGIRPKILRDKKRHTPWQICRAGLALRRELRRFNPDVLLMSLPLANIVGRLFSIGSKTSYLVSFEHSIRYSRALYGPILRALAFLVDAVMADSRNTLQSTRQFLGQDKTRPEWVVPLLSLDERGACKSDYDLHTPARILSVGRLVPEKNYACALEAVARLRDRGHDVHYTIIGDGPELSRLQETARTFDISNRVHFKGELLGWSQTALESDVFLLTSTREGLCLSVAEAMHFGLTVVSTNVGGIREYASDGKNIIFTEGNKPEAVMAALERVLNDDTLRARLGRQATTGIRKIYGTERVTARLHEIRQHLLSHSAENAGS